LQPTGKDDAIPALRVIAYCAMVILVLLLAMGPKSLNAGESDSYAGFGSTDDPDFSGGYEVPLLGITVGNGEGRLQGRQFDGVEIVEVVPGSPAAAAGLKSERRPVKTAMTVAIGLASLAFPPAVMGVSVIDSIHLGESHELIIAVDAIRTRDVRELTIALEQVRPGETVYLTVVRNGHREQLRVPLFSSRVEGGL